MRVPLCISPSVAERLRTALIHAMITTKQQRKWKKFLETIIHLWRWSYRLPFALSFLDLCFTKRNSSTTETDTKVRTRRKRVHTATDDFHRLFLLSARFAATLAIEREKIRNVGMRRGSEGELCKLLSVMWRVESNYSMLAIDSFEFDDRGVV